MLHVLAGLYQSTMKSSVTIMVLSYVGHLTCIVQLASSCSPLGCGLHQLARFSSCFVIRGEPRRARMSR